MVDFQEIVDPKPVDSAGENRSPTDEKPMDGGPSDEIVQVIETLKKRGESPSDKKVRSRSKGSRKRRVLKTTSKAGRESTSKKGTEKKGVPKKIPIIPEAQEIPVRRLIPTSLTNLILFTIIFSVLVAAQIAIMHIERQQTIPLTVASVPITAEEPVDSGAAVAANNEEVAPLADSPSLADAESSVDEAIPEKIEAKVGEGAEPEVKAEIEQDREEMVTEQVEVPAVVETPEVKTPVRQRVMRPKSGYYQPDPFTNSGSQDLDGEWARERYKAGNVVLVPVPASSVGPSEGVTEIKRTTPSAVRSDLPGVQQAEPADEAAGVKDLPNDTYSDIQNPWNSGGTLDLDHPSRITKSSNKTANRGR